MRTLFNDGWKFAKIAIENPKFADGEKPIILDPCDYYAKQPTDFAAVAIPHDWLISNAKDLYQNSVGFYKKTVTITKHDAKKYALRFEAVYMNSAVYVNGQLACVWKYGYTTFEFDITPFVKDGENTIEVIAVYQCPNTRWYSGAGIFRDVYLLENESARIANDGVYFTTTPADSDSALSKANWNIKIDAEISGDYNGCTVRHSLATVNGKSLRLTEENHTSLETKIMQPAMGTSFDADKKICIDTFTATVKNPELWSCEEPSFYILKTELIKNGKVIDVLEQHVGFKTVRFDCDKGCFINGRHVKLHGVCEHHDLGLLGAAFNLTALRRQFIKLHKMGVNSIRTSHNPPSPAFMNLADEMGFLIDDECFDMWEKPKTTYDYGNYFIEWHERDASSWVRRDRNHPCLLMWSIGNEIYDTHQGNGYAITHDLKEIVRRFDPDKNGLVTIGSNYMEWDGAQRCAEQIDLAGYNYGERLYKDHHARHATWCIYGSETSSTVQSRGIYHFPLSNRLLTYPDQQCSCLGNCSTNWGAVNSAWVVTQDRDAEYCAGQYLWTGWDYIGEPTPYFTKNSFFGQIDTAGFEKDTFFEYVAGWVDYKKNPMVHILPNWDYNEGQMIDVRIYSNCPAVELFVNEKSLGKRDNDVHKGLELANTWSVPYKAGTITALAYDENGEVIAGDEQKTPGESETILLEVEEESGGGLYFIDISTTDCKGTPVANARNRMTITVDGQATLLGADNGDSTDYDQYQCADGKKMDRRLFSNKLLAMVQSSGNKDSFTVTVESNGLKTGVLVIKNGVIDKVESKNCSGKECSDGAKKEIPVRKIELVCTETHSLTAAQRSVKVRAIIHPANATDRKLTWAPMMLEGVKSDCAVIDVAPTAEGEEATVTAASDGSFRLTCTAANGRDYPEIVSELEFDVSGVGKATRNPYQLIEACKCSSSAFPVKVSFQGGVFCKQPREWFSFDKVDFGTDGGDTFTLPIFYFDPEVQLELWDGIPDTPEGTLLKEYTYHSPSWYNHYQPNTFTLPRRLFGTHTISIVDKTPNSSLQGFVFDKTPKAFAKLCALDCNTVVGDAFIKAEDAITGIGNNVVLEFDNMDFGDKAASKITICGNSHVDNTIHVKFSGESGSENRIVEFGKNGGYEEKTFELEGVKGRQKVSFVFLPGSNFDFKWFKFE